MYLAVIAGLLALGATSASAAEFQWGVNGHPYVQVGYQQIPLTAQLDLVKELGARWYRCDVYEPRWRQNIAAYDRLVDEAARRGIQILPVIFPQTNCRSNASPEAIRTAAAAFAREIVSRYRGRITHWELDNELDIFAMIHKGEKDRNGKEWIWGDPDGDRPEQYEETRYRKVEAELCGLEEGVKSADPQASTIVDSAGWLHFGFFTRLVSEDHVPFDILGWHWYSEMGDMTQVRGKLNVLEQLKSYGKPIWVTEIDRRGGSMDGKEPDQARYIADTARQLAHYPGVGACFVYELLDEPYFGAANPESYYGLVQVVKNAGGRWRIGERKEAFTAYRKVIADETGDRK